MTDYKQVIILNKELGMRSGKMIAQGAHASVKASIECFKIDRPIYELWDNQGHKKVALYLPSTEQMLEIWRKIEHGLIPCARIIDQGLTQVPPDSLTAIAIGPWDSDKIDELTGTFKLVN